VKYPSGCLLCGEPLVYQSHAVEQICVYCGSTYLSEVNCAAGHYVCDTCHRAEPSDLFESYCLQSTSRNPVAMAINLMSHPSVAMHGPEHHFLVPAVLLASYNQVKPGGNLPIQLRQARHRAEGVMGGSCGFCGNCGAAVGTGIFISLITGSSPLSTQTWQLCNRMTAESLLSIAEHGGPRCCKRDTFLALQCADAFLQKEFGVKLEMPESIHCDFSPLNKQCLQKGCPFYSGLQVSKIVTN